MEFVPLLTQFLRALAGLLTARGEFFSMDGTRHS
jgi:hypothetical protein